MDFTYVYILQSEADLARFYTGLTDDLKDRLCRHNVGEVPHTAKTSAMAHQDSHRVYRQGTYGGIRTIFEIGIRPGLCKETVISLP